MRFVPHDILEIRVVTGVVRYLKSGVVFYTSSRPPRYPLLVDSSVSTMSATISNAMVKQGS